MNFCIRPAAEKDIPAIRELLTELSGHPTGAEVAEDRLRMVAQSDIQDLYVCEAEGDVAGLMGFRIRENLEEASRFGEVSALVTKRRFRGKGVGGALVAYAEERAKERGCIGTWLVAGLDNTGAYEFYKNLGYTINGYRFIKK